MLVFDYKDRAEGINAPTISALGSYKGWQEIEVTFDSGVCDIVMPLSLCSDIPRHESEQQRSGMEYEVANGASIRNERGDTLSDDDEVCQRAQKDGLPSGGRP